MATSEELRIIASDLRFQGRCYNALEAAAINVMSESAQQPNHTNRVAFAKRVVDGNINLQPIAIAVLANASIASSAKIDFNIADGDIQFQINSVFDALAGTGS